MRIITDVPKRVLCVFAHPDDADIGAGGTIAKWSAAGATVTLVVAALGDKGTLDPMMDPAALVAERASELKSASAELGVSEVIKLGAGDGEIVNDSALRETLVAIVRRIRPDVVMSHDPGAIYFGSTYFNHRDHRELGFAVLDAVFPASHLPHYFPNAGAPHRVPLVLLSGTMEATAAVDISEYLDSKQAAVRSHQTQVGARAAQVVASIDSTARALGRRVGLGAAEVFRELRNEMGAR